MLAAFYKERPTNDSPYRQLIVLPKKGGWQVRLSGGKQWRPKVHHEIKVVRAKTFDGAQKLYEKLYRQLLKEGWKPYGSFEPW